MYARNDSCFSIMFLHIKKSSFPVKQVHPGSITRNTAGEFYTGVAFHQECAHESRVTAETQLTNCSL